jgi:hypothetical protein
VHFNAWYKNPCKARVSIIDKQVDGRIRKMLTETADTVQENDDITETGKLYDEYGFDLIGPKHLVLCPYGRQPQQIYQQFQGHVTPRRRKN